jgi:hypothetical protein
VIDFPKDWIQHFGVDLVTATPPDGGGRFRYFLRLRPQGPFSAIVRRVLATDPAFRVQHVGPMAKVVTAEGEYGAWVRVEGTRAGARALRTVGAVFLGDFATALDTLMLVPARFAELERRSLALLHGQRHGLAWRPRQFYFVPPAGWQGVPCGLTASYYPPDFPKNRSVLIVPPAVPLDGSPESAAADALAVASAGLTVERSTRRALASATGLAGTLFAVRGRRPGRLERVHRRVALFVAAPWVYRLQVETLAAPRLRELRALFLDVVASFRPLPDVDERRGGRAFTHAPAELFDGWLG